MIQPARTGSPDYAKPVIGPLREVYGVSDKVLTMTLSCVLLAAPKRQHLWHEVGASMIAIDTLVHNFLVRTGILGRFEANHSYGAACYQPGGCADIINAVAQHKCRGAADRCPTIQSRFSAAVSAVRPSCHPAVLRPVGPRRLQRQSHR